MIDVDDYAAVAGMIPMMLPFLSHRKRKLLFATAGLIVCMTVSPLQREVLSSSMTVNCTNANGSNLFGKGSGAKLR